MRPIGFTDGFRPPGPVTGNILCAAKNSCRLAGTKAKNAYVAVQQKRRTNGAQAPDRRRKRVRRIVAVRKSKAVATVTEAKVADTPAAPPRARAKAIEAKPTEIKAEAT